MTSRIRAVEYRDDRVAFTIHTWDGRVRPAITDTAELTRALTLLNGTRVDMASVCGIYLSAGEIARILDACNDPDHCRACDVLLASAEQRCDRHGFRQGDTLTETSM